MSVTSLPAGFVRPARSVRALPVPFRLAGKYGPMVLAFKDDIVRFSDEASPFYPEYAGQTFTVVRASWVGTTITVRDENGNLLKVHSRLFTTIH